MRPDHTDHHPSPVARRTGLAYLGIIATGIFAEFAVRGSLVVDGDATATAQNIAASPGLFGIGIGADVVMIALDVTVGIGLFQLLRHVDRRLALGTMVLRFVQGAVIGLNLLNLVQALGFARDATAEGGPVLVGPAQEALDAVERHALGYDVGLIAFALSCLVLARLLAAGNLVGRLLVWGMAATGAVYLVGSSIALLAPDASGAVEPLYIVPFVVELAFAIRLVTRGLDTEPTTTEPLPVPAAA